MDETRRDEKRRDSAETRANLVTHATRDSRLATRRLEGLAQTSQTMEARVWKKVSRARSLSLSLSVCPRGFIHRSAGIQRVREPLEEFNSITSFIVAACLPRRRRTENMTT